MNRKTAIAAALAITMSVMSGVVAWSANAGALGFGGSTPVAATQRAVAPVTQPVAAPASSRGGAHDDAARVAQADAERAVSTKGEHND